MKNNNNKKRVLPLLLAILLLISAGAYGTRAFFTDEEELKTSIKIETGTIEIVAKDSEWIYNPEKNSTIDAYNINSQLIVTENSTVKTLALTMNTTLGANIEITNARPGDNFDREFIVTNKSTLDILIPSIVVVPVLSNTSQASEELYFVSLEAVGTPDVNGSVLITKDTNIIYKMKIKVLSAVKNQETFNLNQLAKISLDNVTITAVQPNAKK